MDTINSNNNNNSDNKNFYSCYFDVAFFSVSANIQRRVFILLQRCKWLITCSFANKLRMFYSPFSISFLISRLFSRLAATTATAFLCVSFIHYQISLLFLTSLFQTTNFSLSTLILVSVAFFCHKIFLRSINETVHGDFLLQLSDSRSLQSAVFTAQYTIFFILYVWSVTRYFWFFFSLPHLLQL